MEENDINIQKCYIFHMPNNGIWNGVLVKTLIRLTGIIKQGRKRL